MEKFSKEWFSRTCLITKIRINCLLSVCFFIWWYLRLSIVHDISSSFDCDPTQDLRGVFLDISKAFDKVREDRLLYKLETYGVKGEVLSLLHNYLDDCYQKVILNEQTSSWELIKYEVPQWPVRGSRIMCINDLPDNIQSTCKIFADGMSLFPHLSDKYTWQSELNSDLQAINNWASQWKMQLNPYPNKQV